MSARRIRSDDAVSGRLTCLDPIYALCLLEDAQVHAYYLMSFLSKSYQIVLDRALDTPGHGKGVVDGFNAVQKRYLGNCLRMHSTPKVENIDSKFMRVDVMTENREVSFSK